MPSIRDRQTAWSALLDAPEVARAARAKADQAIEDIRQSDRFSDDYKREQIAQHRATIEQVAREQLARANTARDTLLATARELDAPRGDDTAQLLAETRQGRAWDRVRQQLDGGRHWATLLDEATRAGDAASIRALAAELPAYLKAAGGKDAELVDVEQIAEHLDVATFRVLGDDQGPGTAARLRLHAGTRFPLAEQVIEQAALGGNLTRAMAISYARKAAEDVDAKLGLTTDD